MKKPKTSRRIPPARAEKAGKSGPVGLPGKQIWEIPPNKLAGYHKKLEEMQEALIDLDALLQKGKARINRDMEMALVDLAADAGVPLGTPAGVQGRYFVESKEPPGGQRVVQR